MRKKGSMPSCAQRLAVLGTHEEVRRPARCAGTWAGLAGATCAPVLAVVPRWRDDPTPVGVRCHRGFYTGWLSFDASRCGLAPGRCHSWTLTSLPLPLLAPDLELR